LTSDTPMEGGSQTAYVSERRVYSLFLLLRIVLVASPGYIQPDEFFQGPEIAGRDVYGLDIFVPWEWGGHPVSGAQLDRDEWGSDIPCRSISFPAFVCHLPLRVVQLHNSCCLMTFTPAVISILPQC